MTLSREQCRALELLAGAGPLGYTQATLLAHGFTSELLAGLVRDGLATAQSKTVRAGGRMFEVVRFAITDAGRRSLESRA